MSSSIVVWGSYQWGNFGDDLMAVMTALYLKEHGFNPIVYRLNNVLAAKYKINTTVNLKKAIRCSVAIVIGGGNFLGSVSLIDDDWIELEHCLSCYKVPLHVLSIGGDGHIGSPHLCPSAYRILSSEKVLSGTVRLKTDIDLFKQINVSISDLRFYHDMVLTTPMFFNVQESSKKNDYCVLNLPQSVGVKVVDKMTALSDLGIGPAVHFASTHLEALKNESIVNIRYEFQSKNDSHNIKYSDIESFLKALLSGSFVGSSKLHLGVTAMSYGLPFISIGGAGKTIAYLKQLELGRSLMKSGIQGSRLPFLIATGELRRIANEQLESNNSILSAKRDSMGHWRALDEFLAKI